MQVFLNNEVEDFDLKNEYELNIIKVVNAFADIHALDDSVQVSVSLVDDEQIRVINKEYRKVDKVTDVLSFALDEGDDDFVIVDGPDEKLLGEIMICVPQTIRQAEDFGHSIERELCYLTVHGLLHLIGYDHMEAQDKDVMRSEEEKVMKAIGVLRK